MEGFLNLIPFLVGNPYKPSFPLLLGGGTTQLITYKAILGVGFRVFPYISRIHTAYIGDDSSILGT